MKTRIIWAAWLAASIGVGCLTAVGCTSNPAAPSAATVPLTSTLALSGQSNAVYLRPFLERLTPVVGASQGSTPIAAWSASQPLWTELAPLLTQPLRAFIWWQGESDEANLATYPAALDDLFARVHAATTATLPIILCGANAYPLNASLVALQRSYAATHANVRFVASDDLEPLGASQHLTDSGYATMAARIVDAVR